MADDLTGVPTGAWRDLDARTRAHTTMLLALWAVLLLLAVTLIRKGVIGWADLTLTGGPE